jgi:hypothetical protein
MSLSKGRRSLRYPATFAVLLLTGCAASNEPVNQGSPRAPYSSLCEVYGFRPGTNAFAAPSAMAVFVFRMGDTVFVDGKRYSWEETYD